jgi:hypothetical protein
MPLPSAGLGATLLCEQNGGQGLAISIIVGLVVQPPAQA